MFDALPPDLLVAIVCRVEQPCHVLRTCRATRRVGKDVGALLGWLLHTHRASGAIFSFTSLRCVHRWQEDAIHAALCQLLAQGATLHDDATKGGCVLYWATKRNLANVLATLLGHLAGQPDTAPDGSKGTGLRTWLNSLLKTACVQGSQGCVRVLLERGADPNIDSGRPLKAATEAGCVGCVAALLAAGADVHAGGDCALRVCAAAGSPAHLQVMSLLLQWGADVHAKADEALSLAVERSNADAVALLLNHGADARARQVLESAASNGCAPVVRLLLAYGAAPDADGGRPLRAAAQAGAVDVVHLLLDAGARCGAAPQHAVGGPGAPLRRRSLGARAAGSMARPGSPGTHGPRSGPGGYRTSMELHTRSTPGQPRAGHGARASSSWQPSSHVMALGMQRLELGASRPSGMPQPSTSSAAGQVSSSSGGEYGSDDASGLSRTGSASTSTGTGGGGDGLGWQLTSGEHHEGLLGWEEEDEEGRDVEDDDEMFVQDGDEGAHVGPHVAGLAAGAVGGGGVPWDAGFAGSEALCAALCAGESLVAGVLLERGARVDAGVLRSWRQWHAYPCIMALLHAHRLLPLRCCRSPPQLTECAVSNAVSGPFTCGAPVMPATSSPYALSLQQLLQDALVAAAAEGAEGAVRLFLSWGAPGCACCAAADERMALPSPLASPMSGALPTRVSALHGVWASASPRATPAVLSASLDRDGAAGGAADGAAGGGSAEEDWEEDDGTGEGVWGLLSPACLGAALTAAAAANRPVIVRQLLAHHGGVAAWRRAVLHPGALHAAAGAGHVDVVRALLAAGAARFTLKHQPASDVAAAPLPHSPSPPTQPLAALTHLTVAAPIAMTAGYYSRATAPVVPHNGSDPDIPQVVLRVEDRQPEEGARSSGVDPGVGTSLHGPPPPPYQSEAWGTVVLSAAASCKAGSRAAHVVTCLLLEHGFAVAARRALSLVACGRMPTWRDDAANAVLAAAFGEPISRTGKPLAAGTTNPVSAQGGLHVDCSTVRGRS